MVKHHCELCKCSVTSKKKLDEHKLLPKHLELEKKSQHKCEYCKGTFATAFSVKRHQKTCCETLASEKLKIAEKEIESMKVKYQKDMAKCENDYKSLDNESQIRIKYLEENTVYLKTLLNQVGIIIQSTFNFVDNTYKSAPELQMAKKTALLEYTKDKIDFAEHILLAHKNKELDHYIANIITKIYKDDDPCKQSVWNSDPNRLTYIIRQLIDDTDLEWVKDKNGVKINTLIIQPILKSIIEILEIYKESQVYIRTDTHSIRDRKSEQLFATSKLIAKMGTVKFHVKVSKKIAPNFYIEKEKKKIITNDKCIK
jgi:hypothetical protein